MPTGSKSSKFPEPLLVPKAPDSAHSSTWSCAMRRSRRRRIPFLNSPALTAALSQRRKKKSKRPSWWFSTLFNTLYSNELANHCVSTGNFQSASKPIPGVFSKASSISCFLNRKNGLSPTSKQTRMTSSVRPDTDGRLAGTFTQWRRQRSYALQRISSTFSNGLLAMACRRENGQPAHGLPPPFFIIKLMSVGLIRSGTVQPSRSYSAMHCSAKPLYRADWPIKSATINTSKRMLS